MAAEDRARLRWAFNSKAWKPWDDEWLFLLDLLPEEDQKTIQGYRFKDDQKRSLLSRLMQRQAIQAATGLQWSAMRILRTKGNKPYLANSPKDAPFANFNFNVSHEGDYVVLASEPLCIVGVDVAAPQQVRALSRGAAAGKLSTIRDLQSTFAAQFTPHEWDSINNAGSTHAEKEAQFRRLWSLKEALVKARGDGLGFDVGTAEFSFDGSTDMTEATVRIAGKPDRRWRFCLQQLSAGHWVSVARGPPEAIVDAHGGFKATLRKPALSEAELQEALSAPCPPFALLDATDIVPPDQLSSYKDVVGQS